MSESDPSHPIIYEEKLPAGFASVIEGYKSKRLDLNELMIQHPAATFFVKVAGDSMIGASINPGDVLVVDRSITPSSNKVVVARIEDGFTVKRYIKRGNRSFLSPENPSYPEIEIFHESDVEIWGVVTYVIHKL